MKKLTKFLAILMAMGLSMSTFAACGGGGGDESSEDPYANVQIDATKTQLNVYNYNGGFGKEWLYDVIERFEEKYKDYQGANGKVGVQIIPESTSKTLGTDFLKNPGHNDVFFTEDVFYYDWVNENKMLDLTDALTAPLSEFGETRSVFDKMTPTQQNFYDTDTTDGKKVYAVPYRMNVEGIIYDVELFEESSLYFAKGGAPSEYSTFTQANNANKATGSWSGTASYTGNKANASAGPDGKYGTEDDGLPATYDEFFVLCDKMVSMGIKPFTWTGASRNGYLSNILQQLIVDFEGLDNYNVYMNYSGTATHLVESIDEAGNVTYKPATEITTSNGWQMSASAGRYYAARFFERLIEKSDYFAQGAFSTYYKHMAAQEDFLRGKYNESEEGVRYAFLLDGIWWENEASETFADMASDDDDDSRLNRKFKLMQLPKATEKQIGEKATYSDNLHALCFVNANTPADRIDLAKKFVQFCFTDESNKNFNVLTGTPRPMGYTLDSAQLAKLSMFGKSVYELSKDQTAIAYPFANTRIYRTYSSNRDANLPLAGGFVMPDGSLLAGGTLFDTFMYENDNKSTNLARAIFLASTNALKTALSGEFNG